MQLDYICRPVIEGKRRKFNNICLRSTESSNQKGKKLINNCSCFLIPKRITYTASIKIKIIIRFLRYWFG